MPDFTFTVIVYERNFRRDRYNVGIIWFVCSVH